MLKKALSNVDLIAALAAFLFAGVALYASQLALLCDPRVAFTFGLAAAGRGLLALKSQEN